MDSGGTQVSRTLYVRIGLMMRRLWMIGLLALAGCGSKAVMPDIFPDTVAQAWRRTTLGDQPIEAPGPAARESVKQVRRATYEGPGKIEAKAYLLSSEPVALDVVQRWRAPADTVFFHRGQVLIVVTWQQAQREPLRQFVQAIEKRLAEQTGQQR